MFYFYILWRHQKTRGSDVFGRYNTKKPLARNGFIKLWYSVFLSPIYERKQKYFCLVYLFVCFFVTLFRVWFLSVTYFAVANSTGACITSACCCTRRNFYGVTFSVCLSELFELNWLSKLSKLIYFVLLNGFYHTPTLCRMCNQLEI